MDAVITQLPVLLESSIDCLSTNKRFGASVLADNLVFSSSVLKLMDNLTSINKNDEKNHISMLNQHKWEMEITRLLEMLYRHFCGCLLAFRC